jgi:hypothetical protein
MRLPLDQPLAPRLRAPVVRFSSLLSRSRPGIFGERARPVGGIAPDNAANKPGEFFTFRWSQHRGVLTLSPVAGAVSPANFMAKPWVRISTTPLARFLSGRCPPPAGALPR